MTTANVTKLEDNKVRLDVEVSPEAVKEGVEAKVRELGKNVRVPGFRPGKAPRRIVENHLGRDYVQMEALQERLPTWYSEAVVETDLRPIDQPEIHFDDPPDEEGGFKFSATVEVRPTATLGEYRGVEAPKREVETSEEDLESQLEEMRGQFATLAAVEDRPVQEGDFVILDYKGESMTGGQIEGAEAEDHMLEVGKGDIHEEFDQNVVGANAGEHKQFGISFPMDDDESLAGQSVLFRVHVKEIKERDLPPLDDDFAKEASEFETLEELRGAVREHLAESSRQQVEGEFRGRVLDAVAERTEVVVPQPMIAEKAHEMVQSFERSIRQQGIEPEQYYEIAGSSHHEVEERVKPDAEDTVKKELVLDAVVAAEGIEAGEDEVMHEVGHLAEESGQEPKQIVELMRRNGTYSMIEEEIARRKALDFLVENAVATEMPEEEEEPEAGAAATGEATDKATDEAAASETSEQKGEE